MDSRKMVLINLSAEQQWRCRHSQWKFAVSFRELRSAAL